MRYGLLISSFLFLSAAAFCQSTNKAADDKNISDSLAVERTLEKADSLVRAGKIQQSFRLLRQLENETKSLNSSYLKQSIQIQLASNYLNNSQPNSAQKFVKHALADVPNGDNVLHAHLLSLLGNSYRYQGKYQKALEKQKQAKAMIDSAENPRMYSIISQNIGAIHGSTGNYALAFKNYLSGLEFAESVGDSVLIASSLNSIGLYYNNHGKLEKAQYYLKRARAINKKIDNRLGLLRAMTNSGITSFKLGNYNEAIKFYNQALALHNEIRKDTPPFQIYYNLGQSYKEMGALEKAEEHYKKSLAYSKKAGLLVGLVHNYGALGDIAERKNNPQKAHEFYTRALNVGREIGARMLEKEALKSLYHLEKKRKNFSEALSYHEKYVSLSDSLQKVAKEQEIGEIETKLGLRKEEKINELLQEKQRQQEARITTQNWLIVACIVIIVVILISMYLLYRSNAEKRKINRELEDLNQVKDKILAILSHDLRSPMATIKGVLYLLRDDELSSEDFVERTNELEDKVDENLSMMDNLLVWARAQMSGLTVDIKPLEIYPIVEDVFDSVRSQADKKGISLTAKIDNTVKVKADYTLLELIIRNLVSNSLKFSEKGDQISVHVQQGNGNVIFDVNDNGIGIPENLQSTLFDINGKSRVGTDNEKGTGLGLPLCKEFVEKQGGEIHVESTEGKGTSFIFSLPKAM